MLDDAPFFLYSIQLVGRVMMPPSAVFEHWSAEFDQLYREKKAFVLAMHPQIIGRPSRITLLERLINHIRQHESCAFLSLRSSCIATEKRALENPCLRYSKKSLLSRVPPPELAARPLSSSRAKGANLILVDINHGFT